MDPSNNDCVFLLFALPLSCTVMGGRKQTKPSRQYRSGGTYEELPPVEIGNDIMHHIGSFIDDPTTLANYLLSTKQISTKQMLEPKEFKLDILSDELPAGLAIHIGYISGPFLVTALAALTPNGFFATKPYEFNVDTIKLLHIRVSGTNDVKLKRTWSKKIKMYITANVSLKSNYNIVATSIDPIDDAISNQEDDQPGVKEDITYVNTSECIQKLESEGSKALIKDIRAAGSIDAYKALLNKITFIGTGDVPAPQNAGGSLAQKILVRKELIDGRMRNVYRIKGQGNKLFISKKGTLVHLKRK